MSALRIAAIAVATLLGLAMWPDSARAHEHWLEPDTFVADSGKTVAIGVRVGDGLCGPIRPYRAERTVKFRARARRSLDLAPLATAGDTAWARFSPVDRGGLLVTWESNFAFLKLGGAEFDAYLVAEGLDGPLAVRKAAGDTSAAGERYRRCSKIWVAGSAPDRERACSAIGMPLEIVPMGVPGTDSLLGVRVLFMGGPIAGVKVRVWRAPLLEPARPRGCGVDGGGSPTVWEGRTNSGGIAWVPCAERGQWLIGAAHMVPSADRKEADWESNWASYGFARMPGSPH